MYPTRARCRSGLISYSLFIFSSSSLFFFSRYSLFFSPPLHSSLTSRTPEKRIIQLFTVLLLFTTADTTGSSLIIQNNIVPGSCFARAAYPYNISDVMNAGRTEINKWLICAANVYQRFVRVSTLSTTAAAVAEIQSEFVSVIGRTAPVFLPHTRTTRIVQRWQNQIRFFPPNNRTK